MILGRFFKDTFYATENRKNSSYFLLLQSTLSMQFIGNCCRYSHMLRTCLNVLVLPLLRYCLTLHALTYSVDLLTTVSPLALALHMLLFVPPCPFPLPVCINICVLLFV